MADIIMKGKIATTPKIKCSKNAVACCRFVFEKKKKMDFLKLYRSENYVILF